jgi:hypothetical protein
VHHTTIDDILEGEPMTTGISQAFTRKYEQKIDELECAYRISLARADLLTNQIVRGVTLNITDR